MYHCAFRRRLLGVTYGLWHVGAVEMKHEWRRDNPEWILKSKGNILPSIYYRQTHYLWIANTVLHTLVDQKHIITPIKKIKLETERQLNGVFACYITGATTNESTVFISTLEEIISPVDNPKYLLDNSSWLKRKWKLRTFFVVPTLFSKRKKEAQRFHFYWRKYVGRASLIYTRTRSGRQQLVKARLAHIIYQFKDASKKAITWR